MRAASYGHLEIVKFLLDNGAGVDAADVIKRTVLMYAARHGHVEVVRLLLDKGADAHVRDEDGDTALSLAAYNSHVDVVAELLSNEKAYNVVNPDQSLIQDVEHALDTVEGGNEDKIRALLDKYIKEHPVADNVEQ